MATTLRLEILHQSPIVMPPETCFFPQLTIVKDKVFMLCIPKELPWAYIVFDRNNMAEVKDIIPLPGILPLSVAGCSVTNCLYMFDYGKRDNISTIRITEGDEHPFTISPFLRDLRVPRLWYNLSVTADGNLILSREHDEEIPAICIYNANGSLQHEMRLPSMMSMLGFSKIIPKSNGNLVLVSYMLMQTELTEVDMDGTIVREYQSSLNAKKGVCIADKYGRILIAERLNRMELLDSEFNLMDFTTPQLDDDKFIYRDGMQYDSDRNEIVTVVEDVLTIFRFTEE